MFFNFKFNMFIKNYNPNVNVNQKIQYQINTPDDFSGYNLIITGSIGMGKSTLLEAIHNCLNYNDINHYSFPEFVMLDYNNIPISELLLEMKLKGILSGTTTQNYILDVWEYNLRKYEDYKQNISKNNIVLWDRTPEDVGIFTKALIDYENYKNIEFNNYAISPNDNNIANHSYYNIIERGDKIMQKYVIKKYSLYDNNKSCYLTMIRGNIDLMLLSILNIMKNDIENKVCKNRIIHLKTDKLDQHKNIQSRNRGGENNYYDKPLLKNNNLTLIDFINEQYDNLI